MKYKYIGTTTAVILVGDSLSNIQPGDTVNIPVAPSPQFVEIIGDAETRKLIRNGPSKSAPSKKQQKDN